MALLKSEAASHEVIQAWYSAWNQRDWSSVSAMLSRDFEFRDVALNFCLGGIRPYLRYARRFAEAFSENQLKVECIRGRAEPGRIVVVQYEIECKQTGPITIAGITYGPSPNFARLCCCDLLRFGEQKLLSCVTYSDFYGFLGQLGHFTAITRQEAA